MRRTSIAKGRSYYIQLNRARFSFPPACLLLLLEKKDADAVNESVEPPRSIHRRTPTVVESTTTDRPTDSGPWLLSVASPPAHLNDDYYTGQRTRRRLREEPTERPLPVSRQSAAAIGGSPSVTEAVAALMTMTSSGTRRRRTHASPFKSSQLAAQRGR